MLTPEITLTHIIFVSISLACGLAAIYFWVKVYFETKKGSIAWLLLALTAIFLITSSIFPSIAISSQDTDITEMVFLFLGFWSAVYTSIFAAAGFLMFQAFKTIPRENLGNFLIEGMVFTKPVKAEDDMEELPEVEQVSTLLNRSTLIEYTPKTRYEDSVIEICLRLYGEMVNTVLVSTQPRTEMYKEKIGDLMDIGAMKFIEISSTTKHVNDEDGIIKLPSDEMGKFFELTSKLPEGCAVIFEPITQLILTDGEQKTYEFISEMVERFSASQLLLVGMINKEAHDDQTVSRFEGLFLNLAEEKDAKIRVVKGGKEEYVRFYVGEKFFMEQDVEVILEEKKVEF
ncbi:DUF3795 domain-containing protein [Methanolobus bombayensis]|uniref:DUF3795 domain-containing protein n=1 Tax=Methanolobus bombayensis TaxID=38023 RepID=UPI001AEAF62F|nr:DUF3795 domain-containing protein [Methanolobus bombayensis]MBP1908892.1 succinate dehydrogenase hydrophobic anchor subunit [Methanolobus bombayensis]